MLLSFPSDLCSQSLQNSSSPPILYLMSWFTAKADRVSSYSSSCTLSLYEVHSFGCMPIMIDVYQWHSQINANYTWALATVPLLTMPVCYILAFTFSAVLSAPGNCIFNSFVFCVHKHGLFQNPLLLSRDLSSLSLFFFSLSIAFYISLPYF